MFTLKGGMDLLPFRKLTNLIFNLAILFCIPFSTDYKTMSCRSMLLELALCCPASFFIIKLNKTLAYANNFKNCAFTTARIDTSI